MPDIKPSTLGEAKSHIHNIHYGVLQGSLLGLSFF